VFFSLNKANVYTKMHFSVGCWNSIQATHVIERLQTLITTVISLIVLIGFVYLALQQILSFIDLFLSYLTDSMDSRTI